MRLTVKTSSMTAMLRNVTDAILWHGGEARYARAAFQSMTKADRLALPRFLSSL